MPFLIPNTLIILQNNMHATRRNRSTECGRGRQRGHVKDIYDLDFTFSNNTPWSNGTSILYMRKKERECRRECKWSSEVSRGILSPSITGHDWWLLVSTDKSWILLQIMFNLKHTWIEPLCQCTRWNTCPISRSAYGRLGHRSIERGPTPGTFAVE